MSSERERIRSIINGILNRRNKPEIKKEFDKVVDSKIMGGKKSLSKKTFVDTLVKKGKELGDAIEKLPRLIILIGGPGAGKSFFYNKLITEYIESSDFVYLNRDDIISMIPEYKNVINSNDYLRSTSLSDTITDDDLEGLGITYDDDIEDLGITYEDIKNLKSDTFFSSGMAFNIEIGEYFNKILNKCLEDCIPLFLDITGESYRKLEENIITFYNRGFSIKLVHIYRNTNRNEMKAIKVGIKKRQTDTGRSILDIDNLSETYRRINRNFENIKRMVNESNRSDRIYCIKCDHSLTDKKGKEGSSKCKEKNMEDCQNSIIDHILTPDEKTKLNVNREKKRMEKDSEVYDGNKTRKYSKRHIKYRKKKSSKMKRTKKN